MVQLTANDYGIYHASIRPTKNETQILGLEQFDRERYDVKLGPITRMFDSKIPRLDIDDKKLGVKLTVYFHLNSGMEGFPVLRISELDYSK